MWHDILRTRYGITDERALRLRVHIVTAGSAMTYQEPINNIVRGTVMGLSAVLAGVQSMGISAYDEALSVPSEQAHQQSVRAQQILMHEANLTAVVDPLGGSYYVEALTAELEERAYAFMHEIEEAGGFIASLESGFLHGHASENQVRLENMMDEGTREVVGVNVHTSDHDPFDIDGFQGSIDAWEKGMERLERLRTERDSDRARHAIDTLDRTCRDGGNVMAAVMSAVGDDVTVGEVGEIFRTVYGSWKFPVSF
jgi:methylmalonyl-CoA mutase N-terminal domain/subunit